MTYRTITIDCPWPEPGGGKSKRGADRHYKPIKVKDMPGVILGSGVFLPADDSTLFMWATSTHLVNALWVVDQIGFKYVTNIAWTKPHFGLGQYIRMQHELLLVCKHGKPLEGIREHRGSNNVSSWLPAPHRKDESGKIIHSAKPEESYELIEHISPPRYLEMFARRARPGWDVWGDEAPTEQQSASTSDETMRERDL